MLKFAGLLLDFLWVPIPNIGGPSETRGLLLYIGH